VGALPPTPGTKHVQPYKIPGILVVVVSLLAIAFVLGSLETCGKKRGVCLEWATHRTGDLALIAFGVLFIVGAVMLVYTEVPSIVPPVPSIATATGPRAARNSPAPVEPSVPTEAPVAVATPTSSPIPMPPGPGSAEVSPPHQTA
jgi:hypothetical protein